MRLRQAIGRRCAAMQCGLTMIEVLAAMVVLSAGAVVLFGWIGQAATRLSALSAEQRQLFGELAALEFARGLNPSLQPTGSMRMAETEVRWTSAAVGDERPVLGTSNSEGAYAVQLYRVTLAAVPTGGTASERTLLLAGWRQTRPVRGTTPFGPGVSPGSSPVAPAATGGPR